MSSCRATNAKREGPRLIAVCDGCVHRQRVFFDEYDWTGHEACCHPSNPGRPLGTMMTPDWCPYLQPQPGVDEELLRKARDLLGPQPQGADYKLTHPFAEPERDRTPAGKDDRG
jgi:hypothetical protein